MKIRGLALERDSSVVRASARVVWEDSAREPLVLRFEADAYGADDMEASPEAYLAASVHLFPRRFTRMLKASSREAALEIRSRLQAQLDPLFGSEAVEIVHAANPVTRFGRLAEIVAEPPGVEDLVVCLAFPGPPRLNCGECEKCLRTMTALVALGRLEEALRFPPDAFSLDAVRRVAIGPHDVGYWAEVLPALEARGRTDVVALVRAKLVDARREASWHHHEGWKGRLRRLDRRHLDGRLVELSRRIRRGFGIGEPAG